MFFWLLLTLWNMQNNSNTTFKKVKRKFKPLLNSFKDVKIGHFIAYHKTKSFFPHSYNHTQECLRYILKNFNYHFFPNISVKFTSISDFLCVLLIQFFFLLFFHPPCSTLSAMNSAVFMCSNNKSSLSLIYFSSTVLPMKQIKTTQIGERFHIFIWKMVLFWWPISISKICSFLLLWRYSNPSQLSLPSFPTWLLWDTLDSTFISNCVHLETQCLAIFQVFWNLELFWKQNQK